MKFTDWFENRTGALGFVRKFLGEPVPSTTGWRNTLGSVAGALLLIQILTGFLLALYYVPHPEAAYESTRFIEDEISGGAIVRALHYWGASFMLAALFVHVLRVIFSGAYKKPREVTWLIGLALLALTTATAFTGQLLPWNQEGYWAAAVGVEIAASTPVVGPLIETLLLGGSTIGALTLTRFYALHIVLLPLLLGFLVLIHLYLLRRHGPVRPAHDSGTATIPFHPTQIARDLIVISVVLVGLVAVAMYVGGPDVAPANPSDTSHKPRPEWYFMAHFEVLRMMPGSLKVLATFVLPALLFGTMAALPWLDRSSGTAWRGRVPVLGATAIVAAAMVVLTFTGLVRDLEAGAEQMPEIEIYDIVQAGQLVYEDKECLRCHVIDGVGLTKGPDLSTVGLKLQEDYMRGRIRNPKMFNPKTEMPATEITEAELDALIAYLQSRQNLPNRQAP